MPDDQGRREMTMAVSPFPPSATLKGLLTLSWVKPGIPDASGTLDLSGLS